MKNLTDSVAWSTPIQVPEDSIDLVDGASVETTTLQRLANRTAYLREFVDAQSPVSRTVRIDGTAFCSRASAQADADGDVVLTENSTYYFADIGLVLPTGASLTGVAFRVAPGAARAGGGRMYANWQVVSGDGTIDNAGSDAYDDTTAAAQTLTFSGIGAITVNRAKRYRVYVHSGNDSSTNSDKIHYVDVTFTDPGARNY